MLHIIVYAANIYYWRRYRINYSKILDFKQGTELGHRQVLLVAFSIGVFALLCVLANLDMEVDPETKDYQAFTELLPLFLLIVSSKIRELFCNKNQPLKHWQHNKLRFVLFSTFAGYIWGSIPTIQILLSLETPILPYMFVSLHRRSFL